MRATSAALEAGYRHLDTATVYGNEGEVGRALAESGVPRDDVFLTTKCPPGRAGRELDTLRESLELLQTDHVDLWLIHWPGEGSANADMWRAFVEAREAGLAREIGVSNFDASLIDEVTKATGAAPAVNQIEWSPLLFDAETLAEHRARDIALEGYSALRGGTLEHPAIVEIAERTRAHAGPGDHSLAPAARRDRHPEVGPCRPDPVQRRRRRVQPYRRGHGDTRRPGRPLTARWAFSPGCRRKALIARDPGETGSTAGWKKCWEVDPASPPAMASPTAPPSRRACPGVRGVVPRTCDERPLRR